MSEQLALALNVEVYAATQYINFPFNSMCEFNGKYLGASDSGIFEIEKGSRDNLAPIQGMVEFPKTDFGLHFVKHGRRITLHGRAYGDLLLTFSADDGVEYTKRVQVRNVGRDSAMFEKLRSDCRGIYLFYRLENIDGAFFAIDEIDLDLIVTALRETPA